MSNAGGACASKGIEMVEKIADDLGIDDLKLENDPIDFLKQTCKVLMRNPEDYDSVDPYNCRFYMSAYLRFS
jgi:hypothetical protein